MSQEENRPSDVKAAATKEEPMVGPTRFDYRNALVDHAGSPDLFEVSLNLPLEDGAVAGIRFTLTSPHSVVESNGTVGYRIDMKSDFVINQPPKATENLKIVQRDGLSWELPTNYTGAGTALLLHEPKVKEFLTDRFQRDKIFVDVGANVGAYSVRAAAAGMRVHSFEPNPENARILRRNAAINGLAIEVNECALGSSNGKVNMMVNGAISRIVDGEGIEVPVRTLDSFTLDGVDLLKIDVEGYELEVVKGALITLERYHPPVMIEMHDWVGADKEATLFETLTRLGYSFEFLDKYAHGRHLAVKPSPVK